MCFAPLDLNLVHSRGQGWRTAPPWPSVQVPDPPSLTVTAQWGQNPDGRRGRLYLGMHANVTEKLHDARQLAGGGDMAPPESGAPPATPGIARQPASPSRQACGQQDTIQVYVGRIRGRPYDGRARRPAEARQKAGDAEKADRTADRMSDTLQRQNGEMNAIEKRNSRLAAGADRIKTGRSDTRRPAPDTGRPASIHATCAVRARETQPRRTCAYRGTWGWAAGRPCGMAWPGGGAPAANACSPPCREPGTSSGSETAPPR